MKPNKGHIGVIDAMIAEVSGVKRCGWIIRTFSTFNGYNRHVMRKYAALTRGEKLQIEKLRQKLVGQTLKAKSLIAKEQRKRRK